MVQNMDWPDDAIAVLDREVWTPTPLLPAANIAERVGVVSGDTQEAVAGSALANPVVCKHILSQYFFFYSIGKVFGYFKINIGI